MATEKKSPIDRLIDIGLIGIVGGAGIFFISKAIKNSKAKGEELQLTDNIETQQASRLRSAFNPSGTGWLMSTDGTTTSEVMKIAKEIRDFKAVQEAYSNLYKGDSLAEDLRKELSTDEYNQFLSLTAKKKSEIKKVVTNKSSCPTPPEALYKYKGNDLLYGRGIAIDLYRKDVAKFVKDSRFETRDRKLGRVTGRVSYNVVDPKSCKLKSQAIYYKVDAGTRGTVYVLESDVFAR